MKLEAAFIGLYRLNIITKHSNKREHTKTAKQNARD